MSTRSFICVELTEEDKKLLHTDKRYFGVYCHFDGYVIDGVGETLLRHYNSYMKTIRLLKHGAMESLQPKIKDINFFHKSKKGALYFDCVYFDEDEIKDCFGGTVAYLYIYRLNEGWYWYKPCGKVRWRNMGLIAEIAHFKKTLKPKKSKPTKKTMWLVKESYYNEGEEVEIHISLHTTRENALKKLKSLHKGLDALCKKNHYMVNCKVRDSFNGDYWIKRLSQESYEYIDIYATELIVED